MNLSKYCFECSVIILNVIVRSSILYADEMYYDVKDSALRQLERIEEGYLRKVLNKLGLSCAKLRLKLACLLSLT
jgi:hypothetical protein